MPPSHDDLRSLVLTYEELSKDQRAEADAHLKTCAECKRLFDELALADREADVRVEVHPTNVAPGASPLPPQVPSVTPPAKPAPAQAPRAIGVVRFDGLKALRRIPLWIIAAVGVVAAAIPVVLALTLVWGERRPDRIVRNLRLVPYASAASADAGWHTGQAFALEFRLAKPASPVVFHVDPSGYTDLLYPDDANAPAATRPAGNVRLPQGRTRGAWRFEGGPGPETFLVVAAVETNTSLPEVVDDVRRLPLWAGRAATVRGLQALLERRMGPCERVEVDHLP